MKKISRYLALIDLAIEHIRSSSENDIEDILFSSYNDGNGEPIEFYSIYDKSVQDHLVDYFIAIKFIGYSNKFIKKISFR